MFSLNMKFKKGSVLKKGHFKSFLCVVAKFDKQKDNYRGFWVLHTFYYDFFYYDFYLLDKLIGFVLVL